MVRFNIGDTVYRDGSNLPYLVIDIDDLSESIIKYKLAQGKYNFWTYGFGYNKQPTSEDCLRYGNILTDDNFYQENYIRIRTISYDDRIFYHKMVNGEVVEFKELTV